MDLEAGSFFNTTPQGGVSLVRIAQLGKKAGPAGQWYRSEDLGEMLTCCVMCGP